MKTPARYLRLALLLLVLATSLAVAAFSENFAALTMPRSMRLGAGIACARSLIPGAIAGALAGTTLADFDGECTPTWARAIRLGLPRANPDTFLSGLGSSTYTSRSSTSRLPPPTSWTAWTDTSKMDGAVAAFVRRDAENEVIGRYSSERPAIILRCRARRTEVYVNAGQMLRADHGQYYDLARVRIRFDSSPPETRYWNPSTDREAVFAPQAAVFVRRLLAHDTLRIELEPLSASSVVAVFALSGLRDAAHQLATLCTWRQ